MMCRKQLNKNHNCGSRINFLYSCYFYENIRCCIVYITKIQLDLSTSGLLYDALSVNDSSALYCNVSLIFELGEREVTVSTLLDKPGLEMLLSHDLIWHELMLNFIDIKRLHNNPPIVICRRSTVGANKHQDAPCI